MMVCLINILFEENATLELMSPHYLYARHTDNVSMKKSKVQYDEYVLHRVITVMGFTIF